jgi:hypothetical protein
VTAIAQSVVTGEYIDHLGVEELDREALIDRSQAQIQADKQCRISLSPKAEKPLPLFWNVGGKHGRDTVITVEPGKSVTQPLSKCQVWFGPFSVPGEFATADERRKEKLRKFWAEEKERYLKRYDYPRPTSMVKDGYEPIGPHRSPDVTITIIEEDGTEQPPIRLHQLYKIGDWDPLKEKFDRHETAEQVKARYEAELAAVSAKYEREVADMRLALQEVKGLVKGAALQATGKG